MKSNILIAQKVRQNNQEFLITVVPVKQLWNYTKYTERIIVGFDEQNHPIYNPEIQRKTDSSKIKLIANFLLNDPEAMFPTNIVLSIPANVINDYVEENKIVTLTLDTKIKEELLKEEGYVYISIIDGQHRLKGIEEAIKTLTIQIENTNKDRLPNKFKRLSRQLNDLLEFEIPVSFFIDAVLEYQASIFSTINRTQTKVSESLVYSLFGLTDKTSPQRTSLEVALALNSAKSSPLFNRIKLVGLKYHRGESPVLTQAAVVKAILKCICPTARQAEFERFYKRIQLKAGINSDLCFRRYYANDKDIMITKILNAYYLSVEMTLKDDNGISYWNLSSNDNILQTTIGFETLLNILKLILHQVDIKIDKGELNEKDKFESNTYSPYLIKMKDIDYTDFGKYPKTSLSKSLLFKDMQDSFGIINLI